MIIYIDVLIFTNILINYCILSLTEKFLHIKTKQIRLILSSTLCSLFSLTVFLQIGNLLSLVLKLLCAIILCLVAYKYTDIKTYIKCISMVFAISVIYCGVMIVFYQTVKPTNMAIINDNVYFQIKPLTLILISIAIYIIVLCIKRVVSCDVTDTVVDLKINIDGNVYSCIGKIDTGNSVVEPFSNTPVIITERSVLNGLKMKNQRIIPYKTLNSNSIMYAVKADEIYINKKQINKQAYIGVFDGIIEQQIKAIINSELTR